MPEKHRVIFLERLEDEKYFLYLTQCKLFNAKRSGNMNELECENETVIDRSRSAKHKAKNALTSRKE